MEQIPVTCVVKSQIIAEIKASIVDAKSINTPSNLVRQTKSDLAANIYTMMMVVIFVSIPILFPKVIPYNTTIIVSMTKIVRSDHPGVLI